MDMCGIFLFSHCYKENVYGVCVYIFNSFYFTKTSREIKGKIFSLIMLFSNQKSYFIFIENVSLRLLPEILFQIAKDWNKSICT